MNKPHMTPRERELYLSVMDGVPTLAVVLHQINQHDRAIDILRWLKAERLTGQALVRFFEGPCDRSFLTLIANVVMRIEKANKVRAVSAREFGIKRPLS